MRKLSIMLRWSLILFAILCLVWSVKSVLNINEINSVNSFINSKCTDCDVPDHDYADFVRAAQLAEIGEVDAALEMYTELLATSDPALRQKTLYNRANVNLRQALIMDDSDSRKIPMIELAKQDYRNLLLSTPDEWAARYNLEVSLAMVSEDPLNMQIHDRDYLNSEASIETKSFRVDLP